MTNARIRTALTAGAGAVLVGAAFAHEGHGTEGAHWHAWDMGLVLLALAVVGGLLWWRRGGR
jgi:hypothetical protein